MATPVKRKYTSNELLEIASKPWAKTKDIMALGDCCYGRAHKIKKEIKSQIVSEGKFLVPNDSVPMKRVLKFLDINVKDLEQVVLREERIKNAKAPAATGA